MRLAYFSPFPPQKSGISDYSIELVRALCEFVDIDLWVAGFQPELPEDLFSLKLIDYVGDPYVLETLEAYDGIIYQIGNQPWFHGHIYDVALKYPGVVVCHEQVLYYLVTGYFLELKHSINGFIEEMQYNYGDYGLAWAIRILKGSVPPLQFEFPEQFPLLRRLIESSKGIIVHSDFTRKNLSFRYPNQIIKKINHLSLNSAAPNTSHVNKIRTAFANNNTTFLIGSFGYIAPTKRNHMVVDALAKLKGKHDFKYLLVGEGSYVDHQIEALDLSNAIIKTGYLDECDFDAYIMACDLVINLRHPTMGETSGALIRAMGMGKACIVSNIGWFGELPEDCVKKLDITEDETEQLEKAISTFAEDRSKIYELGECAKKYIDKEFSPKYIAKKYIDFVKDCFATEPEEYATNYLCSKIVREFSDYGILSRDEFAFKMMAQTLEEINKT